MDTFILILLSNFFIIQNFNFEAWIFQSIIIVTCKNKSDQYIIQNLFFCEIKMKWCLTSFEQYEGE